MIAHTCGLGDLKETMLEYVRRNKAIIRAEASGTLDMLRGYPDLMICLMREVMAG